MRALEEELSPAPSSGIRGATYKPLLVVPCLSPGAQAQALNLSLGRWLTKNYITQKALRHTSNEGPGEGRFRACGRRRSGTSGILGATRHFVACCEDLRATGLLNAWSGPRVEELGRRVRRRCPRRSEARRGSAVATPAVTQPPGRGLGPRYPRPQPECLPLPAHSAHRLRWRRPR